ncbi:MAG TPA: TraR/DksA C4-type zinc finger protein [Bacteriovoracaceae bacterium]|nr:TraR/DksA C4-type zinc finger protein [Bacteriovoracaceae bacterium]
MEKAKIEHFRHLFLEILSEEETASWNFTEVAKEGDELDAVSMEKENQLDFRLKTRTAVYLKKVRKSLQKIEDCTFGECEDCGEEITFTRLLARPTADLCIHCKEVAEKEENQMIHRNRASSKDGSALPIEHLSKGYQKDETLMSSFQLKHMSYQDVI